MDAQPLADRVAAVGALEEPIRRDLYDLVSRSAEPVSRDQAAAALGLTRSTAALHLDRLTEHGLLTVEYRRLTGKTGPGAGRPAKLYRRATGELAVSVPERRYDLAAELLAAAIEESGRSGEPAGGALLRIGRETGEAIGAQAGSFTQALHDHGYEPRPDGSGGIVLANCPFNRLAQKHTQTICELNLALLGAIARATDHREHAILLAPAAGRCCVRAISRPA